jgi:hypothetical protein
MAVALLRSFACDAHWLLSDCARPRVGVPRQSAGPASAVSRTSGLRYRTVDQSTSNTDLIRLFIGGMSRLLDEDVAAWDDKAAYVEGFRCLLDRGQGLIASELPH